MTFDNTKIGDFFWRQLSMWEIAPENCIQVYEKFNDTSSLTFHYVLRQVTNVSETKCITSEVTTDIALVPREILYSRGSDIYIRVNYKSTKYAPS